MLGRTKKSHRAVRPDGFVKVLKRTSLETLNLCGRRFIWPCRYPKITVTADQPTLMGNRRWRHPTNGG